MARIHGEAGLVRITAKLDTTKFREAMRTVAASLQRTSLALAPKDTGQLRGHIMRSAHVNCRGTIVPDITKEARMGYDSDTTIHATGELIDAGAAMAKPTPINPDEGLHLVVVPKGYDHHIVNERDELAMHQERPARTEGDVNVDDVDSLLGYLARHGNDDTTVWADAERARFVAVINDHARLEAEAGAVPGWGDHRAHLALQTTPEWEFWMGKNGVLMSQDDFAEHIEDGQRELHEPDPIAMLDIAQSFQATSGASFKRATNVQNGQVSLTYTEDTDARAGSTGDVAIPRTFTLAVAPFVGGPAYALTARFKWRLRDGSLKLGYKLDRPDDVKRDAIKAQVERVREAHGDRVFLGRPR